MKIGIFGGTFNPPHNGHIRICAEAQKALALDKIIIIPSCIAPHKLQGFPLPGEIRLEMCKKAFQSENYEVSDIEIKRGDKSYSVDTLKQLRLIYPDDKFYFIIGSDMLSCFQQWHKWEEILTLTDIIAFSREKDFTPNLSGYTKEQSDKFHYISFEPLELSSTTVRIYAKNQWDISQLVPESVEKYIVESNIYDDGLLKYRKILFPRVDFERFIHSEGVCESAAALARKFGGDVEKASLAGLMHDATKRVSTEEHLRLCPDMSEIDKYSPKIWHQLSCPAYLKEIGIYDEDILAAVKTHTTGSGNMSLLQKIVYMADFISFERDYPDVDAVRKLAALNLDAAILYTAKYTIKKMLSLGKIIHPDTVDCYNSVCPK